jgi:hypothetical protein
MIPLTLTQKCEEHFQSMHKKSFNSYLNTTCIQELEQLFKQISNKKGLKGIAIKPATISSCLLDIDDAAKEEMGFIKCFKNILTNQPGILQAIFQICLFYL